MVTHPQPCSLLPGPQGNAPATSAGEQAAMPAGGGRQGTAGGAAAPPGGGQPRAPRPGDAAPVRTHPAKGGLPHTLGGGVREGAGTERGPHLRRLNQQQLSELRAQVEDLQKALQEQDVSAHLLPAWPCPVPPLTLLSLPTAARCPVQSIVSTLGSECHS